MYQKLISEAWGFREHQERGRDYSKHMERRESGGGDDPYAAPVQAPPRQQAPPAYQGQLDQFIKFLNQQNPFFTGAADTLLQQSQGVDPLFDQYRQQQLGLLGQQQQQQVGALQANLARRGITGSAGINEVNRLNQGFNQQAGAMSSQIGLQGLGRADQSLQDSLAARSAGITQAGFPAGISIAGLGAENAGKGGGGGGGGLCCFIVLEANDGVLPDVVRRYRDEQCTPRKRRGYYRAAEVLVPLMQRSRLAKQAIRWLMVKPLTSYGRWFYGESKWGFVASPFKWAWLGLFSLLGYGKFVRKSGEII